MSQQKGPWLSSREFLKLNPDWGNMTTQPVLLDPSVLSPEIDNLQKSISSRIIGQERAIRQIVKAYVPTTVNMHRGGRPMGVFLFMGPTGVGKSETVKQFAQYLFHDRNAITKIDCTEFQQEHEVMKLLGAPPSYVGYNDTPRLAQTKIDQFQTEKVKLNIILFDEIEKADPRLFDAILSIIGDGTLVLGNGNHTDFQRSFIFLTSNLGSDEVRKLIAGSGIGYGKTEMERDDLDEQIYKASKTAVEKKFRPEFINRLDRMVVFRSLSQVSLRKILSNELGMLRLRIWRSPYRDWTISSGQPKPDNLNIDFTVTEEAMQFLLKEGTSDLYGARELNRAIDRHLAFPLASLISNGQLSGRDHVWIKYKEGDEDLTFTKAPKDWVN